MEVGILRGLLQEGLDLVAGLELEDQVCQERTQSKSWLMGILGCPVQEGVVPGLCCVAELEDSADLTLEVNGQD